MDLQDTINKNSKYLLINSCSKSKKKLSSVKAIELYDGPSFKIIRKYKSSNVYLLILSAKYGLISENDIINYYDKKINVERAHSLSSKVAEIMNDILEKKQYDEILINLGNIYQIALKDSKEILERYNVIYLNGPIGIRLHQLKQWLIEKGDQR